MKERLLLIDGHNIIIAQNSVMNIQDDNGEPIGTYLGVISQIRNYVDIWKPSKVVFVMDGPNAGERRRKQFPQYKNKRRITDRSSTVKIYNEDDKKDADVYEVENGFENQLVKIYNFLKLLPVSISIIPYCEADDVITYISLKNQEHFDVIICSTDKDYLQLVNNSIYVYNWRTKTLYTESKFIEKYKILPCNYIYQKILLGDKSDAILNIKSIGTKTFEALFHKALSENKELASIDNFFEYLDSIDKETLPKKFQKFVDLLQTKESKDSLLLNYKLMKLEELNLKHHHIELLKQQLEEQKDKGFSKLSLKLIVFNDSFNKLYGMYSNSFNADKFLHPFVFVKSTQELIV